jgi:16S rRNA (guanine(966)-N(2))-methyltransferase RsmD
MSTLRVISGQARGRRLQTVPGDSTRPITDRVKESLFNILGSDIIEADLLDLFGGTGAVGIEALSRGAAFVRFIDNHPLAIKTIRANLKTTGLESKAEVIRGDAMVAISRPPNRQFDYLYIAPPQYKEIWLHTIKVVDSNSGWLLSDSWVIVQIHPREYVTLTLKNLVEFDQRRYGSTLLVFYEPSEKRI